MTRFVVRPCFVAGITVLVTDLICPWLSASVRLTVFMGIALLCMVSLLIPAVRQYHVIPFVAAVCLLTMVSFGIAYHRQVEKLAEYRNKTVSATVVVQENGTVTKVCVVEGELPVGTKLSFYMNSLDPVLQPQDRFSAVFRIPEDTANSRLQECIDRAYGVSLWAEVMDKTAIEQTLTQEAIPQLSLFARIREQLVFEIVHTLDGDVGAVVSGICYGADEGLSSKAVSDFRACGVSHLFAVSGMHMTVLVQGLAWLLHRLRAPRVVRGPVCGLFLWMFMAIVGFSASVVRAGVVNLVCLAATLFRRQADTRNSLGVALVLLLAGDPFAAYDAGLLLSFTATFGLVYWTAPIQAFLLGERELKYAVKLRRALASVIALSVAAMCATLPVCAVLFGRVSVVSVLANVLTTTASEVVLVFGCVASLLCTAGLGVITPPLWVVCGTMSRYLLLVCEKISEFSLATVAIQASFLLLWMGGTYLLMLYGRCVLKKSGRSILLGICMCILGVGILLNRSAMRDTVQVDMVGADSTATVLQYRSHTVVITAPEQMQTLYHVRNRLSECGVSQIDLLILYGGEEPILSYVPSVLDEYIAKHTTVLYTNLPWNSPLDGVPLENKQVTLSNGLIVTADRDTVNLCLADTFFVFSTQPTPNVGTSADMVFCKAGSAWVHTDTGLQPLMSSIRTLMRRDNRWYIKGDDWNAVFGTGVEATS